MTAEGLIIKAISGAFYVQTPDAILPCKARGIFRKRGIAPVAGDRVRIEDDNIVEILPRKNELVRPKAANIDLALMTVPTVRPVPNTYVLDKLITVCEFKQIEPVIILTKTDLKTDDTFTDIYQNAGFTVIQTGKGIENREEILAVMKGKTSIFIGNTGAGKSTLLNRLFPDLGLRTAAISDKLGRGRHTTRHVELYALGDETYVADTPGFSSFDTDQMDLILKENLQYAFPDFAPYLGKCQFHDCAHRAEPGCAVRAAVEAGAISPSRYDSYARLYDKAKEIRLWETKQR